MNAYVLIIVHHVISAGRRISKTVCFCLVWHYMQLGSPDTRLGRYFCFCSALAFRTSWFTHRLLCAPYDSPTEPLARLTSCDGDNASTGDGPQPESVQAREQSLRAEDKEDLMTSRAEA